MNFPNKKVNIVEVAFPYHEWAWTKMRRISRISRHTRRTEAIFY
jgi:hypothetical protein